MINLIPKEEKKTMAIDFYYRLLVLFFIVLDFCILIFIFSLAPSYIMSSAKKDIFNLKLETQEKEAIPSLGESSISIIKNVNSKLDLVENSKKNKFLVSEKVINAIILNKRSDIKITKILYDNNGKSKKISITGFAPSRAVLLLFRQSLEDSLNFKSIDLPISNFVKESNIEFYLSLIPS